ncbi:hypothetical protein [Chryseobacterium taklimakanense]|uniref:Uncharacterized protein n=1 Tax=Chryseobacterium taklimakanense TaxID=536441 RepID=A0A3G8WHP1_9FLAO|nr:hypothetical protein [Chryseobacterium taklimakanense]AZI20059.1 hypothetical protein EIH08_04395 [Chryseobacterium taklimakanense]
MLKNRSKFVFFLSFIIIFSCKKNETTDVKSKTDTIEMMQDSAVNEHKGREEKTVSTYSTYKGAWFDIEYPAIFKVENSLKSSTSSEGFDSVFFTSPDGKVQFYIFSPQWSGKPGDIKIQENEKMLETKAETQNGIFINRWTVAAKDGSYFRSFEESSEIEGKINKVFGIKYASKEDLERYREEYLHFKNSLKQFAD